MQNRFFHQPPTIGLEGMMPQPLHNMTRYLSRPVYSTYLIKAHCKTFSPYCSPHLNKNQAKLYFIFLFNNIQKFQWWKHGCWMFNVCASILLVHRPIKGHGLHCIPDGIVAVLCKALRWLYASLLMTAFSSSFLEGRHFSLIMFFCYYSFISHYDRTISLSCIRGSNQSRQRGSDIFMK